MSGVWVTVCILSIAGLAYLMGRQQRDEDWKEMRDDLAIARLRKSPPFKPAKKERVRVCGCGRRLPDDH